MIRSGHVDTFARDNLPPREQWPEFKFTLPELQYPERLNCVTEFVDKWVAAGDGDRIAIMSPDETLTYAQLAERINRIANVLTRDLGTGAGQPRAVARAELADGDRRLSGGHQGGRRHGRHHAAAARQGAVLRGDAKRRSSLRCATHDLSDEMEKTRPLARELERIVYWGDGELEALMARAGLWEFHRLRHRERRCLPDRVHLRHHRRAEGHDAFPARHAGERRQLFEIRAAAEPRRPLHRLAAARLHVRARRARAVPVPHRRGHDPARVGAARRAAAGDRQVQAPRSASRRRPPIARCWASSPSTTFPRCANASPPARRCRRRRSRPGRRRPA